MRISALAKSLIILFLFALLLPFISSTVFAQTKTPSTSNSVVSTNPDVPDNLHNRAQNAMIETMSSLICQLVGIDPINPKQPCLGVDQKTGRIGFLRTGDLTKGKIGGAIGGMSSMITMLYKPPLHAADYFKNLASNFGITKKTYAQQTGTGFDSLSPIMNIWAAFRNIVYLLLVIIFIVIGLAIMLRIKIDPRTVMTIQNQIPKIVVGILAVTFSLAIAGFLIDMMWIFIYLIFGIVSGISSADVASQVAGLNPAMLQGQNPITALSLWGITQMAGKVAWSATGIIQNMLDIKPGVSSWLPFSSITTLIYPTFNPDPTVGHSALSQIIDIVSNVAGIATFFKVLNLPAIIGAGESLGFVENILPAGVVGGLVYDGIEALMRIGIPYLIVFLVVMFAVFIALFRLWFSLLMAYIQILVDIVLAPFWIIGGIIPGSPISFGGWIRDMSANLLAFPATIFMFTLGKIFMDAFQNSTTAPFVPPLVGDFGNQTILGPLIGIGVILITPNIVSMLKQMLKAPKSDMSGNIMKGLSAGGAVPMSGLKATGAYFAKTPALGQKGGVWGAVRNIGGF